MPGPGGVAVIDANGPSVSSVVLADLESCPESETDGIVRRTDDFQSQVPNSQKNQRERLIDNL